MALYLGTAGVGRITLADDDRVELDRISLVFAKRGYGDLIELIGVLNSYV